MRQNWFSWKSWAVGTICGLAVMCMLGAEIRNGPPGPYKLHVWTTSPAENGTAPHHGAYRLDTQTGEVIAIQEDGGATKIQIPQ